MNGRYYYQNKSRLVDTLGTDKRKVWIMMKCLHQLLELKQSDLLDLHLSWASLSIRWMSKSGLRYGNITEEVYVNNLQVLKILHIFKQVYRVVKLLGLHHAQESWNQNRVSMVNSFFLGLQVKQTSAGIFLSQDKYVKDILNKFDFRTIKPASTPIEAHKSLGKDEEGEDVDVHLYRSMIGCLMYLTASRPDIMFAVCLCARFQVTPKVSYLHAVKRIFRYLKHQPKLGSYGGLSISWRKDGSLGNARQTIVAIPLQKQNM
ncbi:hypothetical protein Tco_0078791 [Tanacetum coccineum]